MAVARMIKVSVVAPREMRDELVGRLHQAESVHLIDLSKTLSEDEEAKEICHFFKMDTRKLYLELSRTEFLIELLERFEENKGGLLSNMIRERVHVNYQDFLAIRDEIDLDSMYHQGEELDIELRHMDNRWAELEREKEALEPWKELDCSFKELGELERVEARLITLSPLILPSWSDELENLCPASHWEEVSRVGDRAYLLVLVERDFLEEFSSLTQRYGAESVSFKDRTGSPAEEIKKLEKAIEEIESAKEEIQAKIRQLLPLKKKVLVLNDYLYNLLIKEEAKENFAHTERVFALEGWIERGNEEKLEKVLEDLGKEVDISFSEPGEDDVPPTLLRNRKVLKPPEGLVRLFGLPQYAESDPTWIMAPFFIFFFGLCMGDVGYGVIIALAFWLMQKKLDVSENVRDFLRLFMYCGFATIIGGIITKSYFGIFATDPERFPRFLQFKFTFDTLFNPVPFMGFCCALGLLHISLGVGIEMYDNVRSSGWWKGFCEQGTTLIVWLGIPVLVAGVISHNSNVSKVGVYILAAGAAGVVFLSNISAKTLLGKFFGGLYNLYGLLGGTVGDVASYLRLYALGLATVAIGDVVNKMGTMFMGIPVLGIIALFLILVVGHAFNLVINLLGAFVHPLRLQYVEFFGKFYDGGGEVFKPLAVSARKTVIER